MNEKTLKILISAGAIKRLRIIASGTVIYVEADYGSTTIKAETVKGALKTWASLDAAGRWVKNLGLGIAELHIAQWNSSNKPLKLS
jgi:hypothetical protein